MQHFDDLKAFVVVHSHELPKTTIIGKTKLKIWLNKVKFCPCLEFRNFIKTICGERGNPKSWNSNSYD